MNTHDLKTWPDAFRALSLGVKTFEFRREDTRRFAVGDLLILAEWDPNIQAYTGQRIGRQVNYILRGPAFGIPDGHALMSVIFVQLDPDGAAHCDSCGHREGLHSDGECHGSSVTKGPHGPLSNPCGCHRFWPELEVTCG